MIDYVWCDGDIPPQSYPTVGARPVLSGLRASVAEEIALPMEQRGEGRENMRQRVDKLTNKLGIAHLTQRDPRCLSGGETRLVAVASLLASGEPEIGLITPMAGLAQPAVERLRAVCEDTPQTVHWVDYTDRPRALPRRVEPVGPRTVVEEIPLTNGGVTRLAGPNGAGKSTALKRLARALNAPLSMQFPEAQLILARHTVDGLHPLDLSLGEQRVVSVGLLRGAPYMLIDEPDAGIGPAHWEQIHAQIAEALARGVAVVVACHDERFATDIGKYACVETVTVLR